MNTTISNVTNLCSWQLKLNFNSHIINCIEAFVPDDNIFSGHSTIGFDFEINNVTGSLWARDAIWETSGVTGSGKLCSITFQALSPGISALSFTDLMCVNGTYLTDSNNDLIPFESHDGIIQVNGEGFDLYTFNVTQNEILYNITIFSNSSITNFQFDSELQKISYHASGTPDTMGFCTISIPKSLLNGVFAVLVDNNTVYYSISTDTSYQHLCFNYQHTTAEYIDIQIITTIIGDITGDREVDIRDISTAAKAFGTVPGDDRWDPRVDINNDLVVDIRDISKVARNFGMHWSP